MCAGGVGGGDGGGGDGPNVAKAATLPPSVRTKVNIRRLKMCFKFSVSVLFGPGNSQQMLGLHTTRTINPVEWNMVPQKLLCDADERVFLDAETVRTCCDYLRRRERVTVRAPARSEIPATARLGSTSGAVFGFGGGGGGGGGGGTMQNRSHHGQLA